ncbi:MAG: DUF6090 family protein [Flaviramulus sp.]|nr:DUF6090 family protein [Flaviramulus sp.]
MIKFFQKIRKNLLNEGKTSKYFKYAIGEIVLVVIGILIALQINNWNTQRIENQKEKLLLRELHNEFVQNKIQLDSAISIHTKTLKSITYLKNKLPMNLKSENLDSLSYHLYYSTYYFTYNPSKGIINAISNSATFDLISNDELRKLIISWDDVLADYQEEEINARDNFNNHIKPFIKEHMYYATSPKNMLSDASIDLSFLKTLAFDNMVLDRYYDVTEIIENEAGEFDQIIATINRIIELSKPQ